MIRFSRKSRHQRTVLFSLCITTLLLALSTASGCAGPGYYAQAVSGHWRLMRDRTAIDELLADPETDSRRAEQLRSAQKILLFAESQLHLPAGESYEDFVETRREAVVWNVVAAPEFSLSPRKWCFVVAGCVPYRGYFNQDKAVHFARKLQRKGLDSSVSSAVAYSTLGWFSDPLLDTMLRRTEWQLAATLFHELAHRKLYVQGDTNFNEAYARQVEWIGVDAWLQEHNNTDDRAQWEAASRAAGDFQKLLADTRGKLEKLYASGITAEEMRPRKQETFDAMRNAYEALRNQHWNGQDFFLSWFNQPLNNARIALAKSYEGGHCAFSRLFDEAARNPEQFHIMAAKIAARDKDQRAHWLEQPCSAVASSGHL
jgi:predicted aminopeptidase